MPVCFTDLDLYHIPGYFYWTTCDSLPSRIPSDIIAFTTDRDLTYEAFNNDFGPLDLGAVTRYCRALKDKFDSMGKPGVRLVHFCSSNPNKRANAACLALCYMVIVENMPAVSAWQLFAHVRPEFKIFVDASHFTHDFGMTILDVLNGVEKAVYLGWYDYKTFDLQSFDHCKRVENGDLTWIVPKKFIAFAGPFDGGIDEDGIPASAPSVYIPHFQKGEVSTIVRLNQKQYDETRFTREGFKHVDLIFNDGSCPPDFVRKAFLELADPTDAVLAVHCKAGLGRTGTLIAIHSMIKHGFAARAFMGWIRTCRPGSILGVQQQYLCDVERSLTSLGLPMPLSAEQAREDVGQGKRLNKAKASRKYSAASTTPSGVW